MPINSITSGGAYIPETEPPAATAQPTEISTDRPNISEIPITKKTDTASPNLLQPLAPAPLTDPTTKTIIQGRLEANMPDPAVQGTTTANPTSAFETRLSAADLAQVQGAVKGESTDDKHKDWIEVLSFSHGVSQPTSSTSPTAPTNPAKSIENPAELPTEAVNLNYGKIEWTYTEQKPDGTAAGNVSAKWDIQQNKAS